MNCAFCLEGHKHEDCQKVKNVKERKQILLKYGRCFNCIRKGHVSRECKTTIVCKYCKGKHHSCLCCANPAGEGKTPEGEGNPSNLDSAVGNSMHIEQETALPYKWHKPKSLPLRNRPLERK